MAITDAEQYGIELLNRARLDPAAEAHRYGISLNSGLHGDHKITASQKQVLAPSDRLDASAQRHSDWMISANKFSHEDSKGRDAEYRMDQANYASHNSYDWAENIAYMPMTRGDTLPEAVRYHHRQFMESTSGHREHVMGDVYREIGLAQEHGRHSNSSGSMITQNFGNIWNHVFVTGVAYTDRNNDSFYSIGEGRANVRFTQAGQDTDVTGTAGGYSLQVDPGAAVRIKITAGTAVSTVLVDTKDRFDGVPHSGNMNVKLDLVDGDTVYASSNLTLVSGADNAKLLGINPFRLTGSDDGNGLTGNRGHNLIMGMGGDDMLSGRAGRDNLLGNSGDDRIYGGAGNDKLQGGTGDDRLAGGAGADRFVFGPAGGSDHITDFKGSAGDRIVLDHDLWDVSLSSSRVIAEFARMVSGDVVLDFSQGQTLTFDGLGSYAKLAAYIDII